MCIFLKNEIFIEDDVFYKEIAQPFIEKIDKEIEFAYFNLQDYQKPLRNDDKADDDNTALRSRERTTVDQSRESDKMSEKEKDTTDM